MEEYLDIKNQAIEDSKSMNFEGMDNSSKLNAALVKLKDKQIEGTKAQMVYVSNLLIPDDEEFLKSFREDKSIKNLASKYSVPDYVINIKVSGLQDKIDAMQEKPAIEEVKLEEGENNMEEFNFVENNVAPSIEPFELKPVTSMEDVQENVSSQSVQKKETVDALEKVSLLLKKSGNQEGEISSLNKEIEELEAEKEELENSNKGKDDEIANLKELNEKLEKTNSDLEEENNKKASKIESLNEDIDGLTKKNNDLEEENSKKDTKIEDLNKNVEDLEKEVSNLNDIIDEKDKNIEDLGKENENKIITIDSLRSQLAIATNENAQLRKEISTLETYKNDYDKIMSYLNQNLSKEESNGPRLAA